MDDIFSNSSDDESAALDRIRQRLQSSTRGGSGATTVAATTVGASSDIHGDDDSSLSSVVSSSSDESSVDEDDKGRKNNVSHSSQSDKPLSKATAVVAAGTSNAPAARVSTCATTTATGGTTANDDSDDDEFPFIDPVALQAMELQVPHKQHSTTQHPIAQQESRFFSPSPSTDSLASPSPMTTTMRNDYSHKVPQGQTQLVPAAATMPLSAQQHQEHQGDPHLQAPPPQKQQQQLQPTWIKAQEPARTRPEPAVTTASAKQNDRWQSIPSPPKPPAATAKQDTLAAAAAAASRSEQAIQDVAPVSQDTSNANWNVVVHDSAQGGRVGNEALPPTRIEFEERRPEVHYSLCAPPPFQATPEPIVHYYSPTNRPVAARKRTAIAQIFDAPINSLWKNKFKSFNTLQSEIANSLAYSDDNIVVSAPTGAGKTAVFEMAMARFFQVDLQHNNSGTSSSSSNRSGRRQVSKQRKIVYVAPSKALCEERFEDWSQRTAAMQLGIEVALITGDGDPGEAFRDLASAHLILTTPEKWDSLTRKWTENFFLFGCVKLLLIDEVHLLADNSRGCCLESIVCRMKGIQRVSRKVQATAADIAECSYTGTSPEAINSTMRIVAVSATLPNIADIASFVDANEAHSFDETYRPVPLTVHVVGQGYLGDKSSNQFHFWSRLEKDVPNIIHRFSKGRPTIIFCHSKAETERLADILATANGIGKGPVNADIAGQTRGQKLQRVLLQGIAYHHAGLELDDRRMIERAFIGNRIRALCATSTLAMGVNLPAHLVVIKGTKAWRGGASGYADLDQASLLQMIGRAGRPGFDTSGTAVIMTDNASKAKYEKLGSSGLELAKSSLLSKLVEVVNTEMSQLVITSTEAALDWIKGTLYYVQLSKDPQGHGLSSGSSESIDLHLLEIFGSTIRRLQQLGAKVSDGGRDIVPVPANHIMSQQLVTCEAMELFVALPFDATQCQVLRALTEIEDIHRPVRRSEKKVLNETHKIIRFKLPGPPSKVRVQKPPEKAFVLLQAGIGQIFLEDYAMRQEMSAMVDYSSRMLVAVEDYSVRGSMHGQVAVQSLKLRRSLATSLWNAGDGALNQLMGVGQTTSTALKFNGITSFSDVLASTEEVIEKAAQRVAPFGSKLRTAVFAILRSTLTLSGEIEFTPGCITPKAIVCRLEARKDIPLLDGGVNPRQTSVAAVTYTLIVHTDRPGGCLMYQKNISSPGTYKVASPPTFGKITMVLVASMVGLDEKIELEGNAEVAPSSFSGQASGTKKKKSSQRQVRDPKRTKQSDIASHFKKSTVSTEDPRMRRSVPSQKPSKKTTLVSQAFWTSNSQKKSVTPSPKPGPSNAAYARASATDGGNHVTIPSTFPACPSSASALNQHAMPTHAVRPMHDVQHAMPTHAVHPMHDVQHAMPTHAVHPMHDVQPVGYGAAPQGTDWSREYHQTTTEQVVHKRSPATKPDPAWKQAKREQQRSQQRAFANKRDNPFSLYQHDPNDAESLLDVLSSQNMGLSPNNSSIIPVEGLRALTNVTQTPGYSQRQHGGGTNRRQAPKSAARQRGRRQFAPSGRDTLARKAAVCNDDATVASFETSQYATSPFPGGGFQPNRLQGFEQSSGHFYVAEGHPQSHGIVPMHQSQAQHVDDGWADANDKSSINQGFAPPIDPGYAPQRGFETQAAPFYGDVAVSNHAQYHDIRSQGTFQQTPQVPREQFHGVPEPSNLDHRNPSQHPRPNAPDFDRLYGSQMAVGGTQGVVQQAGNVARGWESFGSEQTPSATENMPRQEESFGDNMPRQEESLGNNYGMEQKDLDDIFF